MSLQVSIPRPRVDEADGRARADGIYPGNHDITLDRDFYARSRSSFHNQNPQDPEECISLFTSSPTITYLCHSQATIRLTRPDGPQTTFTVFGSPYSPRLGLWAFDYARPSPTSRSSPGSRPGTAGSELSPAVPSHAEPTAAELWSSIPLNTDILVTHTPPHLHCDRSVTKGLNLGCEDLRRALWRVRPRLHVCGHIHDARGAERVRWDIDHSGKGLGAYAEIGVEQWEDPSPQGNKISLVDLTGRGRSKAPLDNDGSRLATVPQSAPDAQAGDPDRHPSGCQCSSGTDRTLPGLGEDPGTSSRCNLEALRGRMGRQETCVVNAAIAATSWPHVGGKRFHKPIVVDLNLPVWDGQEAMDT